MLKWALIVVGALAVIVVLVASIGAMLPTGHVAKTSTTLGQPPDSVWAVLRDLGNYPTWMPDVKSAERLPDRGGREVWLHRNKHNQKMPLEIVESEPPARLVMRIADANLPFGGTWTYEIAPTPGGCRIVVTEDGEIYNPIFRFLSRFVFGQHATMEAYLRALGARFKEEIRLERLPSGAQRSG